MEFPSLYGSLDNQYIHIFVLMEKTDSSLEILDFMKIIITLIYTSITIK